MNETELLLAGVIAGLMVAMAMLGRSQVVIAPVSRDERERSGCLLGPLLLFLALLGLLALGGVTGAISITPNLSAVWLSV